MQSLIDEKRDAHGLAREWYQRCATVAVGHYKTAERSSRRHAWVAGFSAALSAIVGTSVFSTLQLQPELWVKIVIGLLSIAAAVLAALSGMLNLQDKAEKHRAAASKYNAVGRELEELLIQDQIGTELLKSVRLRLDSLSQESPHIPKEIHNELTHFPDIGKWGGPSIIAKIRDYFVANKQ